MKIFHLGVLAGSLFIITNSVQASDVGKVIQTTGAASKKVIDSVGNAFAKNNVLCRGDVEVNKSELHNDITVSGGAIVDTVLVTKNCNGDIKITKSKVTNKIKASSGGIVTTGFTN
jgi:hypothetical protein